MFEKLKKTFKESQLTSLKKQTKFDATKFNDEIALKTGWPSLVEGGSSFKNSNFTNYKINLVMNDASRMNLVDLGSYDQIVNNSETLAIFLDKPIWNEL